MASLRRLIIDRDLGEMSNLTTSDDQLFVFFCCILYLNVLACFVDAIIFSEIWAKATVNKNGFVQEVGLL